MEKLGDRMPFGRAMNIKEIHLDKHFKAREMIVEVDHPGATKARIAGTPVKMTGTPGAIVSRSPFLGEHTIEELRAAGIDQRDVELLLDQKVTLTEKETSSEAIQLVGASSR